MARMLSLDTKVDKYTICYHITSGLLTSLYKAKRAGKTVFLKQFNKPSPKSEWYKNYIRYQNHIKKIIEENDLSDFFLFFFDDFEAVVNERKNKKAYFQVFQLIEEGSDLREIIKEYKKQDPFSLNIWSRVFVSSMNRLHKHGIVHSDLKPENLFLVRDPDIKVGYRLQIIDMDFSFLTAKKAPWHGFDGYATTIGYQSPEHLLKKNIPGTASDIFTMGLILYELLCGYHPYSNLDIDEYKENVLNFKAEKPKLSFEMKNSENIINCLHNCLNPDPKKRPSAQEIFASLIGKSSQELNSPAPSPTNKPNTVSESKVNTPTENETISADSHISFMFLCNRESMESISEIAINGQLLKAYDDPNHKFWNHENQFTLRPQNNFWQIIPNLKSENKTILNGKELEKNKLLRKGDVLGIGNLKKGILKDAIKVL